jgi:NADH dehydrogenase [ubiquinone] 1 alpha subcomplex assembly factor 6
MPSDTQKAFFVLRAFNVEIASIKEMHHARHQGDSGRKDTSPTLALQLRLQWWSDAIRQIYGEKIERSSDPSLANLSLSCWESPIVRALDVVNREMNFTRRFLERLIEARELDLELNQFGTMEEAATYAEKSVSSLLYLSLECFGVSSLIDGVNLLLSPILNVLIHLYWVR